MDSSACQRQRKQVLPWKLSMGRVLWGWRWLWSGLRGLGLGRLRRDLCMLLVIIESIINIDWIGRIDRIMGLGEDRPLVIINANILRIAQ